MDEIRRVLALNKNEWLRFEVDGEGWLARCPENYRESLVFRMEKSGDGWFCQSWVEILVLIEPTNYGMVSFYDHLLYLLIVAYLNYGKATDEVKASRREELEKLGRNYPRIKEAMNRKPLKL